MERNEKIEYAADAPVDETGSAPAATKDEMRRAFSRMALGLCLGLLVSELVPTVLQLSLIHI